MVNSPAHNAQKVLISPGTVAFPSDESVVFRLPGGNFKEVTGEAAKLIKKLLPALEEGATIQKLEDLAGPGDAPHVGGLVESMLSAGLLVDFTADERLGTQELVRRGPQLRLLSGMPTVLDPFEKQIKLQESTVGVWRLGGVGSQAALALAAAGVRNFILSDDTTLTEADVNSGGAAHDVGLRTVEAITSLIKQANPEANIETVPFVTDEGAIAHALDRVDAAIVAPDTYPSRILKVFNRAALKTETPWVPAYIDAFTGIVGPMVIPNKTACFRCFELRDLSHKTYLKEHERFSDKMMDATFRGPLAANPAFGRVVGGLAASEVFKLLADIPAPALSKVQAIPFGVGNQETYQILRLPLCDDCGEPIYLDKQSRS